MYIDSVSFGVIGKRKNSVLNVPALTISSFMYTAYQTQFCFRILSEFYQILTVTNIRYHQIEN